MDWNIPSGRERCRKDPPTLLTSRAVSQRTRRRGAGGGIAETLASRIPGSGGSPSVGLLVSEPTCQAERGPLPQGAERASISFHQLWHTCATPLLGSIGGQAENETIRAGINSRYGGPEVVEVRDAPKPVPKETELLVC